MALQTAWCNLKLGLEEQELWVWHEVGTKAASSDTGFCSNGKVWYPLTVHLYIAMVPHLLCYTWLDLVPSRFRYLNRNFFFFTLTGLFSVTVVGWISLQKEHHVWDSLQTDSVSHAAVPKIMGNASEGNMSKMLSCVRSSHSFFLRNEDMEPWKGFICT